MSTTRENSRSIGGLTPLWACVALLAVIASARLIAQWPLPIPACGLRALTGIPCPLCGSTRALAALSRLDLLGALHLNPLVTIGCGALVGWAIAAWISEWMSWRLAPPAGRGSTRALWLALGLGAVAMNWLYLFLYLPK